MSDLLSHVDWRTICAAAATVFLQSSLVLILGLGTSAILRKRGAAVRSAVLRATLAAVILCPAVSLLLRAAGIRSIQLSLPLLARVSNGTPAEAPSRGDGSAVDVPSRPVQGSVKSASTVAPSPVSEGRQNPDPPGATPPAKTQASTARASGVNAYAVCASVWFIVAALLTLRLLIANALIAYSRHAARPAPDSIRRACERIARELRVTAPQLLISRRFQSPCLIGWLRPAILLPHDNADAGDEVMLHEIAHIVRRDCLWQLLARLTVAALWFQPLAWLLVRQIERAAEESCDDVVLAHGGDRAAYARCLIKFTEHLQRRCLVSPAVVGVVSFKSNIGRRIIRLLDESMPVRAEVGRASIAGIILCSLLLIGVASLFGVRGSVVAAPQNNEAEVFGGKVLSPEGKPVEGAEIFLFGTASSADRFGLVARGKSDSNGRFSLQPERPISKEIAASLTVRATGYGLSGMFAHHGDTNDINLEPPTSVRLKFIDEALQPVPQLRVTLTGLVATALLHQWIVTEPPVEGMITHVTDATGELTFSDLPAGGYQFQVRILDERFAKPGYDDRVILGAGAVTQPRTLVLHRAGIISGRTTFAPTSKPAAGLMVLAASVDRPHLRQSATSGPDGTYRITNLAAGSYRVFVYPSEELSRQWAFPAREQVEVMGGQTTADVDLALTAGSIITGKVLKADTGEALAGMEVAVNTPFRSLADGRVPVGFEVQRARADAHGEYLLHVPPGSYVISLIGRLPDGYQRYAVRNQQRPDWGASQDVTIADGQTKTVDVKLFRKPGQAVSGLVVDEAGKPVENAYVSAEATEDTDWGEEAGHTTTDVTGHFRLQTIPPYSLLRAGKEGLATATAVEVNGGETDVVLHLIRGTIITVTGIITDARGKPLEKIAVTLMEHRGAGGMQGAPTFTDSAGRFRFTNLSTSSRYTISAGGGNYWTRSVDPNLVPGKTNEVNIVFK